MQSAVEADLNQLKVVFGLHARLDPAVDTSEILKEISARLREELDYDLEARHTRLYGAIFAGDPRIRVLVGEALYDANFNADVTATFQVNPLGNPIPVITIRCSSGRARLAGEIIATISWRFHPRTAPMRDRRYPP